MKWDTRRWGIISIVSSLLAVIAPYIVIPIFDIPLIGSLSAHGGGMLLLGLVLWFLGCVMLLIWRIKNYGKASVPRSAYVFGILFAIHLAILAPAFALEGLATINNCQVDEGGYHPCAVFGVDFGNALAFSGSAGWLIIGFAPFILAFEALTAVVAIWATVALLRKPRIKS